MLQRPVASDTFYFQYLKLYLHMPWSISSFLYFRYSFANIVTMMQEGRIHPRVATIAPGTPAIFKPTEAAELTASQMHLYLALLFRRDYFAPVRCIPIWLFCSTGIISASQIHPCLALLFSRDYFNRPNSSLPCFSVPQGLFPPARFISVWLFCSTGIISTG